VVLRFESVDGILKCDLSNNSYLPVVLFIVLYKVIITFESVDEILKCDQANESFRKELSSGVVCHAVRGRSYF